ncbi:MAG: YjbE family putative metal transport protein [Stellaceae bacterium]
MLIDVSQLSALLSVVIIDVVLAGDNAILVGMAASGLAADQRRRVIVLGILIATALRLCFALITAQLLAIIGLTLAGGVLLLWVSWKMYRELRQSRRSELGGGSSSAVGHAAVNKTPRQALIRIVLADVSMSLDNVLAVAGTARNHFWVLAFGLILSVALMGVASNYVARLLERHFWISWIGLGIITFVALRMIWEGSTQVIHQTAALAL